MAKEPSLLIGLLVVGTAVVGRRLHVRHGGLRPGVFAPAALHWLAAFPLGQTGGGDLDGYPAGGGFTPPADVLGFLAYQGIVSFGWTIGFLWLHERIAPHACDGGVRRPHK